MAKTTSRGGKSGSRRGGHSAGDLRRQVESGTRHPFYLLHGEEDFERDNACKWLVEQVGPETARDFNFDVLHGNAFDPKRFLDVYNAYPMMSPRRLVLIKACDKLSADHCHAVERIVDAPSETTVLIATGAKADLRRKFWQQMSRQGLAVEFRTPYDNEIPQWVSRYANSRGLRLEDGVADLLRLYVGSNLRELAGELDKLTTYVGVGETITRQALEELVGASRTTSVFELTDAVGQRQYRRAQKLLHSLMAQGEDSVRIVPMVSRHIQLLLRTQQLEQSGLAPREMSAELGISPFFLSSYRKQAAQLERDALWDGLGILQETDSQLKSLGRSQQQLVMDLALSDLSKRLQGESSSRRAQ